jgi:hypothetical protein
MAYRDHQPIVLDKFNGLWNRNDPDETPLDHFQDCENIKFVGVSSFATRDGINITQSVSLPISNVKRIYNFPCALGNTLIALSIVNGVGSIYHVINATTTYGPLLSIYGMEDFAFIPYAGRAYISPIKTYVIGSLNVEKGLDSDFVYVYKGDGTAARKAAGDPLIGQISISNGNPGHTDAGLHIFGFVGETDTGYLTPPGALNSFTTVAGSSVSFGNVPQGRIVTNSVGQYIPGGFPLGFDEFDDVPLLVNDPNLLQLQETVVTEEDDATPLTSYPFAIFSNVGSPYIVKRHLVASKVITGFNGDLTGYTLYFVPDAIIPNNTDLFLNNISFYDQDLLDDASHLFDNRSSIPAVASLSLFHNRLVACCTSVDISLGMISHIGEPEAISAIDGLIVVPPDGNPITNGQELRDILYIFKRAKTVAFIDNGGEPATWPEVLVDNALGTPIHGISTVLDSGASTVDFLIVATYQGISLFNGRYITPELSWKIEGYWRALSRSEFRKIQIINAPIQKEIYIILPTGKLLVGNYGNGLDPMKIRWAPWSFAMGVNSIAVWNIDEILIGANEN